MNQGLVVREFRGSPQETNSLLVCLKDTTASNPRLGPFFCLGRYALRYAFTNRWLVARLHICLTSRRGLSEGCFFTITTIAEVAPNNMSERAMIVTSLDGPI
jgi:hypothetical protein